MFASEHLNNHTPPHVIQALLGHVTTDTVMVYAKLYPAELVEGYRRALRGTYVAAPREAASSEISLAGFWVRLCCPVPSAFIT